MFKENTKVSFTAASETEQMQISNDTILGGHLGVTQGYLTYTYFVVDPNKQTGYRVIIDGGNGKVLYLTRSFTRSFQSPTRTANVLTIWSWRI
jgi:uncharacterized membrane protein YkoI